MKILPRLPLLATLLLPCAVFAQSFVMPKGLTEIERKRFERFEKFQIKGVCGDRDLERLSKIGVNTVRGYTIPGADEMRAKLDEAQRLGMKMIVSEWMANHGKNKSREGTSWDFDYNVRGDEMVENLIQKIEAIGDHPAILMWGLGNEVHLDEPYLRVVNRMSEEIHKRFPHHLTSLTVVNVKDAAIEAIKKYAPDLDVLGVQSYSLGAVRGSIKRAETLWEKPFYMSEFNTKGPWNFANTEWGVALDEPVTNKVRDLKDCYAAIDASPLCLGSTIFIWGHAVVYRPTYFSLLLDPEPNGSSKNDSVADLLITPQAEVMQEHFIGKPPRGNRAPVISKLEFEGAGASRLAKPGELMRVAIAAEDPNRDSIEYVTWILDSTSRKTKRIGEATRYKAQSTLSVPAPTIPGEYLLLVYAQDKKGGASASTLAFKVPAPLTDTP
jgi:Glycosyl hydrolases family 2, TIM barrel domain